MSTRKVTKEEWEQKRREAINQARKLSDYGDEDIAYYYSASQIIDHRCQYLKRGAKVKWPRGYSKWTIRHFSPIRCDLTAAFSKIPVTCLLRSPDGQHYISEHLPGFCPIHQLLKSNKNEEPC